MGIKTIYFTKENELRLMKEKNMSGLINELLSNYYKNSPEEVIAHVKEIFQKQEDEIKQAESRREIVIRLYKKRHEGIEPTEEEIEENMNLIEKFNKRNEGVVEGA